MKTKLLVLGVLLAPCFALAGTPIDETRSVDARARIEVHNVKGAVNIVAWDKSEVAISGTLGEGARRLAVVLPPVGDVIALVRRVVGGFSRVHTSPQLFQLTRPFHSGSRPRSRG